MTTPKFPFTDSLQQLQDVERAEHDRLRADGVLCPRVFRRIGKKVKGKPIVRFTKSWRKACEMAGCPGRIPHDLRRTAVRKLVRADILECVANADDRSQDAFSVRALRHRKRTISSKREEAQRDSGETPVTPRFGTALVVSCVSHSSGR